MTGSVHAPYCADHAVQVTSPVVLCEQVAEKTYRVRVEAPEIAQQVVPGQFVMMRVAGTSDPLIGRALAVYDVLLDEEGVPRWIDVIFVAKGKFTTALAAAGDGATVTVWGPLGNSFRTDPVDTLVLAVGGVGQTPMLLVGSEALGKRQFGLPSRASGYAKRVIMVYGARSQNLLATTEQFANAGMELVLCTDDGSAGIQGRVPDVLASVLRRDGLGSIRVATCGPEIMMEKVAQHAALMNVPCEVSLETPMACGIGICFTCVARVRQADGAWDYKRTCVEGPIFDAAQIVWDESP